MCDREEETNKTVHNNNNNLSCCELCVLLCSYCSALSHDCDSVSRLARALKTNQNPILLILLNTDILIINITQSDKRGQSCFEDQEMEETLPPGHFRLLMYYTIYSQYFWLLVLMIYKIIHYCTLWSSFSTQSQAFFI